MRTTSGVAFQRFVSQIDHSRTPLQRASNIHSVEYTRWRHADVSVLESVEHWRARCHCVPARVKERARQPCKMMISSKWQQDDIMSMCLSESQIRVTIWKHADVSVEHSRACCHCVQSRVKERAFQPCNMVISRTCQSK